MHTVDDHMTHAAGIAHPPERQRWLLEAADAYRVAVVGVADALGHASPASRGLAAASAALRAYVASDAFATLVGDTSRLLGELAGVTYRMRIYENRVIVGRHDGEPDYGAEVLATFARFRRSSVPAPVPVDVFRTVDMNHSIRPGPRSGWNAGPPTRSPMRGPSLTSTVWATTPSGSG
jgi:hypothetical protein